MMKSTMKMKITDIPLDRLRPAPWDPNRMDESTFLRLEESIRRYGLVVNLVARPLRDGFYEVISGNWRLQALQEMGFDRAPCIVVDLDEAHTRLLAQALNHIHGQDDLGLRAQALREILKTLPEREIASLLPDTADTLKALASIGEQSMADYLRDWQQTQTARLKHLHIQLTTEQLPVVEQALAQIMSQIKQERPDSPNARGTAIYLLCKAYLEREVPHER